MVSGTSLGSHSQHRDAASNRLKVAQPGTECRGSDLRLCAPEGVGGLPGSCWGGVRVRLDLTPPDSSGQRVSPAGSLSNNHYQCSHSEPRGCCSVIVLVSTQVMLQH